jgi:hypothetical protein
MDSKLTSTKRSRNSSGFVLAEVLVSFGITALLMVALASVALFSGRSFAALANYVDLDDHNRLAIDQLTRDLRQANRVVTATTNSITMQDSDGVDIVYSYSAVDRTLTRVKGGVSSVLLRECERLAFSLGQRNAVGGSYDVYPAASAATAKVVNVAWLCSRSILGVKENTESVQTARIVIRKQGT